MLNCRNGPFHHEPNAQAAATTAVAATGVEAMEEVETAMEEVVTAMAAVARGAVLTGVDNTDL